MKMRAEIDHLDLERFLEYEHAAADQSKSLQTALELIKAGCSVIDVGGASGMILSELLKRSPVNFQANLMEVDDFYKSKSPDDRIQFIKGSILGQNHSGTYDIVMARQILHHMIGKSFGRTRGNQLTAIENLWKMVKPRGHLILEEEINNNMVASRMIFYGSRLAKFLKLKIKSLELGRVVVRFMDEDEIMQKIRALEKAEIQHRDFAQWHFEGLFKATQLMNNVGCLFLVIQKGES